jgi:hypothetical protein
MLQLNNSDIYKAHPVDLLTLFNKEMGATDWLDWEVETVLAQFNTVLSQAAQDKVLAIQSVLNNIGLTASDAIAFEKVVHAFCNNPCIMDALQAPSIEEIFYTVKQIKKLVNAGIEYVGEIPGYVAAVAAHHDWVLLPLPLSFAQEALYSLLYLTPGTERWKESEAFINEGKKILEYLDTHYFTDYDSLENETMAALFIRRILGAYLYDPTTEITYENSKQ